MNPRRLISQDGGHGIVFRNGGLSGKPIQSAFDQHLACAGVKLTPVHCGAVVTHQFAVQHMGASASMAA
jgi:hypothetical protein